MKKKVAVCGWYGPGNFGDELILNTLINWIHAYDAEVAVLSFAPEKTSTRHSVEAIDILDVEQVNALISGVDLLIVGGGGLFQTYQDFSYLGLLNQYKSDVSVYLRPVMLANQYNCPVVMWGQGLGPLETLEGQKLIKHVFSKSAYISVRDNDSALLLKELGIESEVVVAPDPVWSVDISKFNAEDNITDSDLINITLIVRPWAFDDGWEDTFVQAISNTFSPENVKLNWLPFQPNDIYGRSSSDIPFIKTLIDKLSAYNNEIIVPTSFNELVDVMISSDKIIAMRLHAQILAVLLRKPVICIEYEKKMALQSDALQLSDEYRLQLADSLERWEHVMANLLSLHSSSVNENIINEQVTKATKHRDLIKNVLTEVPVSVRSIDREPLSLIWKLNKVENILNETKNDLISRQIAAAGVIENKIISDKNYFDEKFITSSEHLNHLINHDLLQQVDNVLSQIVNEKSIVDSSFYNNKLLVDNNVLSEKIIIDKDFFQDKLIIDKAFLNDKILLDKKNFEKRDSIMLKAAKGIFVAPKVTTYKILKKVYWSLPPSLRSNLNGLRFKIVRSFRQVPNSTYNASTVVTTTTNDDFSWEYFKCEILDKGNYKGIFIQEIVIDWDVPLYQRPQHIACAMGRLGYLVIYKTANWSNDNVNGFREVAPNVWLTNSNHVNEINNSVRSFYSTAYSLAPDNIEALKANSTIIYEYIDHIDPAISGDDENIRRLRNLQEYCFSGGADYIVASAKKLEHEAIEAVGEDKVILAQNGVDTRHYRNPKHEEYQLPKNYIHFANKFSGKLVGYFGALAPWLWYEELEKLVLARPDLGFVFIGPDYYGGSEKLVKADNVLYLGTIDYKVLPAYAKKFDICFIPFFPGEIARTTSPLKLFEYFALEKPVVVTSEMNECVAFDEVFHGSSAAEFSEKIDQALAIKDDPLFRGRMAQLADQNDWDARAKEMSKVFK